MVRSVPARLNLRLKQETYDVYKELANALGVEMTGLVRQIIEQGEPMVIAMTQSVQEVKAGRISEGVGLYGSLMDSVMKQGELVQKQAQVLQGRADRGEVVLREEVTNI